jgi:hypothetical protein
MSRYAALDCAGVYADAFDPIQIERNAAIGFKGSPIEDDRDGTDYM